jgi:hypothetical protein
VLLTVFPAAGITLGGAALLGMTAAGGTVGAWSASMIGISESSELVKQFESAIDSGKTLILCRLPSTQANAIFDAISSQSFGVTNKGEIQQ